MPNGSKRNKGAEKYVPVGLREARKAHKTLGIIAKSPDKAFSHIKDLKELHLEFSAVMGQHRHRLDSEEAQIPENIWNRVSGLGLV